MITIIKPGVIKPKIVNTYFLECSKCTCVFEFNDTDINSFKHLNSEKWIYCPFCDKKIILNLSQMQPIKTEEVYPNSTNE